MGTMRERRPGVWQLRVAAGVDAISGKRIEITETFRGSKRAAATRLAELGTDVRREGAARTATTLGQMIDVWRAQAGHELGTARNYDLAVATIPQRFLATQIGQVRATGMAELVRRVVDEHGPHRGRLVHAVISGALTHAWRLEWLPTNPARRVPLPAAPGRRATQPDDDELAALLAEVATHPQLLAWLLASADLGARPGEVLALRWRHVDIDRGQVLVEHALDPIDGHVKATKTHNVRTVAISPVTVAALRAWRVATVERALAAGVPLADDPFVFSDALDSTTPWRPDTGTKRFARIRQRAGVTGVRRYDLRHYVATTLLAAGVDPRTVSGRLGHRRMATTTDTYGHVEPARDRAAADVLGERLGQH